MHVSFPFSLPGSCIMFTMWLRSLSRKNKQICFIQRVLIEHSYVQEMLSIPWARLPAPWVFFPWFRSKHQRTNDSWRYLGPSITTCQLRSRQELTSFSGGKYRPEMVFFSSRVHLWDFESCKSYSVTQHW